MNVNEISAKIAELRELRRMAEEIAAEITALEDSIKAHMTAQQTDVLHGPGFKVTWNAITSSRLDSKALKAEAPELWQRYSKQTTTRRFVVA